jgi:LmbE family N-acetylglucosaminyl deacetylase
MTVGLWFTARCALGALLCLLAGAPDGTWSDLPAELDLALPPGRLLWVGAHPDDEVLLAPLLGALCVDGSQSCSFIVATRGENGACRLAAGCHPSLGTVRSEEMQAAARLFDAELLQGALPDVFGPRPAVVRSAWAAAAGGEDALIERLRAAIAGVDPALVLTFDPRHGSTCHPAHRALGRLVLEAVARLPVPPPVYLLEDRVRIAPGGTAIRFSAALRGDPALLAWDGNAVRADGRETLWSFVLTDASLQPSQFDATFLAALRAVPPRSRRVFLLPATARTADPTPVDGCP